MDDPNDIAQARAAIKHFVTKASPELRDEAIEKFFHSGRISFDAWNTILYQVHGKTYVPPPKLVPRDLSVGPGTELKHVLEEVGITDNVGCGCAAKAAEMNRWGVAGTRARREQVIDWLEKAAKKAGWQKRVLAGGRLLATKLKSSWFKITDPYGSIVDEAIRRASLLEVVKVPERMMTSHGKIVWSYGVTTVPQRFKDYLPKTLESLHNAGFDTPRLFIDGHYSTNNPPPSWHPYEHTVRVPQIRAHGNWVLAALELFIRNPSADRYAIFQDDILACSNLREYLERCMYPFKGYLNLITYPENVKLETGWSQSNQKGLGAQGLVFSQDALRTLLHSPHMVDRPMDSTRGHKRVDGGIVDSMRKAGWSEYIHNPSLIGHVGLLSAIGNKPQPEIKAFLGEQYDPMPLIKGAAV